MQKTTVIRVAKTIGMWIPAILLVLIFAKQGWSKFDDASGWARAFRHWGYPDWFRVTIGVLEVGAAALLLLGRTAAYGANIIIVVMVRSDHHHRRHAGRVDDASDLRQRPAHDERDRAARPRVNRAFRAAAAGNEPGGAS
jgi:hypothetical protein